MNNIKKLLIRAKQAVKILSIREIELNSPVFIYRELLDEVEEELAKTDIAVYYAMSPLNEDEMQKVLNEWTFNAEILLPIDLIRLTEKAHRIGS